MISGKRFWGRSTILDPILAAWWSFTALMMFVSWTTNHRILPLVSAGVSAGFAILYLLKIRITHRDRSPE